jgi:hypothetical protein
VGKFEVARIGAISIPLSLANTIAIVGLVGYRFTNVKLGLTQINPVEGSSPYNPS